MTNKNALEALNWINWKIEETYKLGIERVPVYETIRQALEVNQELEAVARLVVNDWEDLGREFWGMPIPIRMSTINSAKQALAKAEAVGGVCKSCGGDGIERCDNPDHGLLGAMSFRGADESRCPCCGHDEKYRMKHWDADIKAYVWNKCPDCSNNILGGKNE